jgi:hypothetical protein
LKDGKKEKATQQQNFAREHGNFAREPLKPPVNSSLPEQSIE